MLFSSTHSSLVSSLVNLSLVYPCLVYFLLSKFLGGPQVIPQDLAELPADYIHTSDAVGPAGGDGGGGGAVQPNPQQLGPTRLNQPQLGQPQPDLPLPGQVPTLQIPRGPQVLPQGLAGLPADYLNPDDAVGSSGGGVDGSNLLSLLVLLLVSSSRGSSLVKFPPLQVP